jgi:ribonuclease BN (tRNA processing enzyme)
MEIIFLGTNGWYDTRTGDTVCVLINTKKYSIILDAGNGIYKLEKYIDWKKPAFLFLTHFHLDHVFGFHIFPTFRFKNGLKIFTQKGTKKIIKLLINYPFTMPIKDLPFKVKIKELSEGKHFLHFLVEAKFLVHSSPVLGYRLEIENKKIAYCTDTGDCENLRKLAKKVDLLITECGLKPKQTPSKDWLHLNPEIAAKIAKEEEVKKLVLTHFGAHLYKTLKERKEAERVARKIFKNTLAAYDGLKIKI